MFNQSCVSFISSVAGISMASAQCLYLTPFHAFGGLKLLDCDLNLEVFESKVNVCIYIFDIGAMVDNLNKFTFILNDKG